MIRLNVRHRGSPSLDVSRHLCQSCRITAT
ncbi:hypothetical protein RA210_U10376 [Rubrivivax sp. A210]|nr:hypothetical protein RA210_U10376 [Rubrivivax sp. A210]